MLYGHLLSLAVHAGVGVQDRALFGTAAMTVAGSDATPYIELRVDGQSVDPVE
jgi:septal ring factor EnvC (AmiA/AmiB activator)